MVTRFTFDGTALEAPRGVTIAGALLANGIISWRRTAVDGRPRGLFCGNGSCFDCLVDVGDRRAVRACLIPLREGDQVHTSTAAGPTG
jgi:D-hydroxyproline dehydrogenase subunit gamma